ncbi:glycosyltransferase family 87 protein [Microcoleus sp. herbarium14]|uniref:glycosyltransferase family 87 protein n=1 Tax=Microcoleus sp. herbarium14 TaxID=3055439 RepID=UPI002FD5AF59
MTESFKRNFGLGLLAVSILSLICFGIIGIGREGQFSPDGGVVYAAGRAWLNGLNAYNHDMLTQSVAAIKEIDNLQDAAFFYPPQSAAFCMFVGLFDYSVAKFVWLLLNLLSIAAIISMTVCTINKHQNNNQNQLGSLVMAAMIIGNPFTVHVVWMGQTSLMAFAGTMAAWYLSQRQKFVLAGICLAIASFKPQLCLLVGIWFLLERNWKILAVAFATVTIMSAYPLVLYGGPVGMLLAWHQGIQDSYSSLPFNQPGFQDKVGMESLFVSLGLKVPAIKIVAIILAVLLWVFRSRINREDILALLMGISFTFLGYTHVYDYVGLFPILTSLWLYCSNNRNALLGSIALVFLLFFPRRIFLAAGLPFLIHWRTIVVLLLVVGVAAFSMKAKSSQRLQEEMA